MEELEKVAYQRKQNLSTSGHEWKLLSTFTPSEQELDEFYDDLSIVSGRQPAMLSLIPQYSEIYTQSSHHLPTPLHSLYEPQNLHLNYHQLLSKVKGYAKSQLQRLKSYTWKSSQGDKQAINSCSNTEPDALLPLLF